MSFTSFHCRQAITHLALLFAFGSFVLINAHATESPADQASPDKAAKPLRILILGGTGFTGPAQVKYALARGHKVTLFNRGKTHPGEVPAGVEQLIGDRN